MKREVVYSKQGVNISYELTPKEIEVLKHLKRNGYLEFRINYTNKNPFDSSKSFLESDITDLSNYDFITLDFDAWHTTYLITEIGEEFISQFSEEEVNTKVASDSPFDLFVEALLLEGYNVQVNEEKGQNGEFLFKYAHVTGFNIRAGFTTPHDENDLYASNVRLNNRLVADHFDCFDKWSKAPLNLPLPSTQEEIDHAISRMKFWGSLEGLEKSNDFETEESISKKGDI